MTQCRHTENPHKANLDRHDLDELWAATSRLHYDYGLLVTNADMTTPAKASFRNGEYSREGYPGLMVWNNRDLWDEIRKNQNILNRWFSGLAQLHSVKRFSFRALLAKMPDREPVEIKACIDGFIAEIMEQGYTVERTELSWKIENDDVIIFMREWFASVSDLFTQCALKASHGLTTAPFSILEFHIINKTNQANYEAIREFLCSILLEDYKNEDGKWATLLASPLIAPVYIHDTEDAILSVIKPYASFVVLNNGCHNEISTATSPPDEFTMQSDDELVFIHRDTGILFWVNYSQPVEESRDDTLKIISFKAQETFKKSIVFEVSYNNHFELSMALASVNMINLVLEDTSQKKLYFCFVKDGKHLDFVKADILEFLRSLKIQNIHSRALDSDDLIELNERLRNELQFEVQTEKACHTRRDLIVPIDFRSRVTTSMAEIDISSFSLDYENVAFELFKYKMQEQGIGGFDEGFEVGENAISFRQLRNILWRPTRMTRKESINIGIKSSSDPIKLMIYFKPNRIETLSNALKRCHERTLEHVANIRDLIANLQSSR